MADQEKIQAVKFFTYIDVGNSILGASICIGRKMTYFIRASESGEINKGNSSIIGDEEIKIERQGSIISSTTKVEGG